MSHRRILTTEAQRTQRVREGSRTRTAIACWGEVDAALAELGRLEQRLSRVEQQRRGAMARAEAAAQKAGGQLEVQRRGLERALERFCRRQGPELGRVDGHGRRSRRLLFGRVGYRRAQAVVVRSEAAALRALVGWRAGQKFLRMQAELDRETLRRFLLRAAPSGQARSGNGLGDVAGRLRQVGIRLERRERWFYEVDQGALEKWG